MTKRLVTTIVAVAYLVQLTGCAVRLRHRVNPADIPNPETERIVGLTTAAGEEIRLGRGPRVNPFETTREASTPFFTRVDEDSLYSLIDGEPFSIALADIQEVWVKRTDPGLTVLATVALVVGVGMMYVSRHLEFKYDPP